jgi:predicted RNA binding protein YcfA (HicA-like mRNA interferase family)
MAKAMKARLLLKKLAAAGFESVRSSGSHFVYLNEATNVTVVVPVHGLNDDIPAGTVNAILKQAGLK